MRAEEPARTPQGVGVCCLWGHAEGGKGLALCQLEGAREPQPLHTVFAVALL